MTTIDHDMAEARIDAIREISADIINAVAGAINRHGQQDPEAGLLIACGMSLAIGHLDQRVPCLKPMLRNMLEAK